MELDLVWNVCGCEFSGRGRYSPSDFFFDLCVGFRPGLSLEALKRASQAEKVHSRVY